MKLYEEERRNREIFARISYRWQNAEVHPFKSIHQLRFYYTNALLLLVWLLHKFSIIYSTNALLLLVWFNCLVNLISPKAIN